MASIGPASPRLPSPPPPAEIQIGHKAPSSSGESGPGVDQMEQSTIEANSRRRIHRGTKTADMATGPPLIPLNEVRTLSPSLCFAQLRALTIPVIPASSTLPSSFRNTSRRSTTTTRPVALSP
jgi:hypothetical protein